MSNYDFSEFFLVNLIIEILSFYNVSITACHLRFPVTYTYVHHFKLQTQKLDFRYINLVIFKIYPLFS